MRYILFAIGWCMVTYVTGQTRPAEQPASVYLLKPARVFDGVADQLHEGWAVFVRGERIEAAGLACRSIEVVPASLEDVFVSRVRHAGGAMVSSHRYP